uniref:RING-type domain-containing protein n=1 Tax=Oryza brachyantha TaxID=4533 RepID=J3MN96_ORYBR
MAHPDGNSGGGDGHVVVDVGASSCAVCTEPLEWAAVGPCGHGDVCPGCSLHIRAFQNNRLCCICRAPCHFSSSPNTTPSQPPPPSGPPSPRGYRGLRATGTRRSRDG